MERIFTDENANIIANEILKDIQKVSNAMDFTMEGTGQVNEYVEPIQHNISDFALLFFRKNMSKLNKIIQILGRPDNNCVEISDGIVDLALGLAQQRLILCQLMTKSYDFRSNLNSPEVREFSKSLPEMRLLYDEIRRSPISNLSKNSLEQFHIMLKNVEKAYKPGLFGRLF